MVGGDVQKPFDSYFQPISESEQTNAAEQGKQYNKFPHQLITVLSG